MEIEKRIFIYAAILTLLLFGLIFMGNQLLNQKREQKLTEMRDELLDEIENMKAFTAISNLINEEENCNILQRQLTYLDESIWVLGQKLDSYKQASKNIFDDPFYQTQKKRFIVNQILYLSIHDKMKDTCETKIPLTIIYFYANARDCQDCDAQSFVLTDINKEIDEEISIFSLDIDINVIATKVLVDYYNVTSLPCTVIEQKAYCGIKDKQTLISYMCKEAKLSIC